MSKYGTPSTAAETRERHGMPRPASARQASPVIVSTVPLLITPATVENSTPETGDNGPFARVVIDLPASAASPTCGPAPIPPRETAIDYAFAINQARQAEYCALGIHDFMQEALKTAKIDPAKLARIDRFVAALNVEIDNWIAHLVQLDLHQPFGE